jgi:hypothetical protein
MSSNSPGTRKDAQPAAPAQSDPSLCPACGNGKLRRSHRRNAIEAIRSWFGYYPYRCPECQNRLFWKSHRQSDLTAKPDKRPEAQRRTRQRTIRQILFYALAVAAFIALLLYIIREPPQ